MTINASLRGLAAAAAESVPTPNSYEEINRQLEANEHLMGMLLVAAIMILSILTAIAAVLAFMFTMTLFRIPEEHRKMELGKVWLTLIPLYGAYWIYIVVLRTADSFKTHFDAQDPEDTKIPVSKYGRKLGLGMCIAATTLHLAALALLVFTSSSMLVAITMGVLALAAVGLTIGYFVELFRVRSFIPDPESAIPEDYL